MPENKTPVLVVDDDRGLLTSIRATLVSAGMPEPALLSDSERVLEWMARYRFQLVLLDLIMPRVGGMEVLKQLKEEHPTCEVVVVTAVGDVASAVQAMKFGAYDYLVKPIQGERLIIAVDHALERCKLRHGLALFEREQSFSDLRRAEAFSSMVAADESMARVFLQAENVAETDYDVVITGESGTGKELLARVIHSLSDRGSGPFVGVNMAAFSRGLFEDAFFGHTKGAFTGAVEERKGFFETAEGGTLFLDEIAEMDRHLQAKLLRVIEERELYRLGSTRSRRINVRLMAASNRDLVTEVERENFRSDLFYRLNMFHIHIPPLRERRKDILPLAHHFLRRHVGRSRREIRSIAPDAERMLLDYGFPGNVRELEHVIAGAVLMERSDVLSAAALGNWLPKDTAGGADASSRLQPLKEVEKRHILMVLKAVGDNRTHAAKVLGIGLRTLQRRLKEFARESSASD